MICLDPRIVVFFTLQKKKAHEKGIKNEQNIFAMVEILKKMKNKWKSW